MVGDPPVDNTPKPIHLSVVESSPPQVRVGGDLDLSTAVELDRATVALDVRGGVVLDLLDVTFLDSSGVSAIVRLADRAGGLPNVQIVAASERALRVLELCGIAVQLGHHDGA